MHLMRIQPLSMQKAAKWMQKRRRNISYKCRLRFSEYYSPGWLLEKTGSHLSELISSIFLLPLLTYTVAFCSQFMPTISCGQRFSLIMVQFIMQDISYCLNIISIALLTYSAWIYSLNNFNHDISSYLFSFSTFFTMLNCFSVVLWSLPIFHQTISSQIFLRWGSKCTDIKCYK